MFNKLLGSVVIMGCSFFITKSMTDKLKKRKNSLTAFHSMLVMLESEISFSANSIDRAFQNISESVNLSDFFEYILSHSEFSGIRKAWSEGVENFKDSLCLNNEDVRILKTLSSQLGITDKENQIKNIHYVLSLLEQAEKDAHAKFSSLSKLYSAFGMSAGLTMVILLL